MKLTVLILVSVVLFSKGSLFLLQSSSEEEEEGTCLEMEDFEVKGNAYTESLYAEKAIPGPIVTPKCQIEYAVVSSLRANQLQVETIQAMDSAEDLYMAVASGAETSSTMSYPQIQTSSFARAKAGLDFMNSMRTNSATKPNAKEQSESTEISAIKISMHDLTTKVEAGYLKAKTMISTNLPHSVVHISMKVQVLKAPQLDTPFTVELDHQLIYLNYFSPSHRELSIELTVQNSGMQGELEMKYLLGMDATPKSLGDILEIQNLLVTFEKL